MMKRVVPPFLSLALGVALLGVLHNANAAGATRDEAPPPRAAEHTHVSAGTVAGEVDIIPPFVNDDRAEIRRRVRDGAPGTYIGDILHERDSALARWADRKGSPLTVWIQPRSKVTDFTPAYVTQVREAFIAWGSLNLPINFSFVRDSAAAEVHVTWIDRFKTPISGRTRWSRDEDWVITDASITLAMHHWQGELLDEASMHAMALHEIGHLLGLDHTKDSLSVMAPIVRVRRLSSTDVATVRLLYALPAGPLR